MNSAFVRQFLWSALVMFVAISIGDIWSAFRRQSSPPGRAAANRINQTAATAVLFAVIALLIYWLWPSPDGLGFIAGAFLTMPVESLIERIRTKREATAN